MNKANDRLAIFDVVLAPLERPVNFALTTVATALVLTLVMGPVAWTSDEINYFDLAWRLVSPGDFGPNHAVFDHSLARSVSFAILGGLIKLFGQDGALIVARLIMIVVYGGVLAYLAQSLALSAAETLTALMLFVLVGQNYFASEWLFGGTEPKEFAYAAVMASIGLAWRTKSLPAVLLVTLATYFHFLVGGFWAAAIILLLGLRTGNLVRVGQSLLIYTTLILPILALLLYEQFLVPVPDVSDLDLTLNQIYSLFRNFHHVAPFSNIGEWLPGISWMVAVTALLSILALQPPSDRRLQARWLLVLHVYLVLSFVLAFFDRHTYVFGPLYLFRPNSLILLLTLMFGLLWLRQSLAGDVARTIAVVSLATILGFAAPRAATLGNTLLRAPQLPLERSLEPKDRELVDWLRGTNPHATIVIQPGVDLVFPWIALERLIDRPTLVSFKFDPTTRADIARWYRLVRWREAVFGGDCTRVFEQPVDYLVTLNPAILKRVANCGDIVWTNGDYGVVRVAKPHS